MYWVLAIRSSTFSSPYLNIDQFEILSVIGRGSYGKVMLCKKKDTGEYFAIKTIRKSSLSQSNRIHTVMSERNILTKASHPFIVSLKFAFQSTSKFYFGLEFVPGGDIGFHLQKNHLVHMQDIILYIVEISLALHFLHERGIVYRDLKPENVLLDAEGHVKLTDFGLAKDLYFQGLTSTMCGTVEYFAPEIVGGESYGVEVDWWTLGIFTYVLLFRKTPFEDKNRAMTYKNIMEKEPVFPKDTPEGVKEFISACLAKDRKKRINFTKIKSMKLFDNIDFDSVLKKQVKPLFVPQVIDYTNLSNFSKEFTQEAAKDSYVCPVYGSEENIIGFSYYCEGCDSFDIDLSEKSQLSEPIDFHSTEEVFYQTFHTSDANLSESLQNMLNDGDEIIPPDY